MRNGLKEVIKRLEPDLNIQVRAINEVIIIYLFHRYNVMQILTHMMCKIMWMELENLEAH